MLNLFKRATVACALSTAIVIAPALVSTSPLGALVGGAAHAEEQKTKRVPAMRNRVYTHLALAQEVGDKEGIAAGLAKLDDVKENIDQLNSYERAMLWNFYGFMHYNNEDMPNALDAFSRVVAEDAIPDSLRSSTLRSIAQLHMMQGDYADALAVLKDWQNTQSKALSAADHVLFAQNYYQMKDFENALASINSAIDLHQQENKIPQENWLVLKRAALYELKQPEQVTKVMEQLVRLYDKPEYWVQLAGMYGEIGQEAKQLATMEAAWQAGYVTKAADIKTLAQLYLYHSVPYKAAELLETAMEQAKLTRNEKHLQLLSQAYVMAKEDEKAIAPLLEAGAIANHGNHHAQLAEIYLHAENWHKAIEFANKALEKGDLNYPGNAFMVLGMANFSLRNIEQSMVALEKAKEYNATSTIASQWIKYVNQEQHVSS